MGAISPTTTISEPFLYNQEEFISLMRKDYPVCRNGNDHRELNDSQELLHRRDSDWNLRHRYFSIPSIEVAMQQEVADLLKFSGEGYSLMGLLTIFTSLLLPCCAVKMTASWILFSAGACTTIGGQVASDIGSYKVSKDAYLFNFEASLVNALTCLNGQPDRLRSIASVYRDIFDEDMSYRPQDAAINVNNVDNGLKKRIIVWISNAQLFATSYQTSQQINCLKRDQNFIQMFLWGIYLVHMKRHADTTESFHSFVKRNKTAIRDSFSTFFSEGFQFTQETIDAAIDI